MGSHGEIEEEVTALTKQETPAHIDFSLVYFGIVGGHGFTLAS
jgi:hypothetical protein